MQKKKHIEIEQNRFEPFSVTLKLLNTRKKRKKSKIIVRKTLATNEHRDWRGH